MSLAEDETPKFLIVLSTRLFKTIKLTKRLTFPPPLVIQEISTVSDVTVYDPFTVEPVPAQYKMPFTDINYMLFKRGQRMCYVTHSTVGTWENGLYCSMVIL